LRGSVAFSGYLHLLLPVMPNHSGTPQGRRRRDRLDHWNQPGIVTRIVEVTVLPYSEVTAEYAYGIERKTQHRSYVMSSSPKLMPALALVFAFVLAPFAHAAGTIVETVEVGPNIGAKVERLLMVGTSALNTDAVLGNKQALIGAEVRKLLKGTNVLVFPVGMKPGELDPQAFIAQAVAKSNPTHVMTITIPSGLVRVKRSSGETVGAESYVVRAEVVVPGQNTALWAYSAEVTVGLILGASNAQVAESIVARMRADGLL
jgi:hypothetical protein